MKPILILYNKYAFLIPVERDLENKNNYLLANTSNTDNNGILENSMSNNTNSKKIATVTANIMSIMRIPETQKEHEM